MESRSARSRSCCGGKRQTEGVRPRQGVIHGVLHRSRTGQDARLSKHRPRTRQLRSSADKAFVTREEADRQRTGVCKERRERFAAVAPALTQGRFFTQERLQRLPPLRMVVYRQLRYWTCPICLQVVNR